MNNGKKFEIKTWMIVVFCVIFGCLSVLFVTLAIANNNATKAQEYKNVAKYKELKAEVTKLDKKDKEHAENIKKYAHSASEEGSAVAKFQNIYSDTNLELQGDFFKNEATYASKYFKKPAEANLMPWIPNISNNGNIKWEFKSTYSFAGDTTECIWVCRDNSNIYVYGYTTAIFDNKTKTFSNVKVVTTEAGKKLEKTEEVDKTVNMAKDLLKGVGKDEN